MRRCLRGFLKFLGIFGDYFREKIHSAARLTRLYLPHLVVKRGGILDNSTSGALQGLRVGGQGAV